MIFLSGIGVTQVETLQSQTPPMEMLCHVSLEYTCTEAVWVIDCRRWAEIQRHRDMRPIALNGPPYLFVYLCVSVCKIVGHLCLYLYISTALLL